MPARVLAAGLVAAIFAAAPALAAPASSEEDAAFEKRLAALEAARGGAIAVEMKPDDDPAATASSAESGVVLVAGGRMDIYTPPLLTAEDIQAVIQQHMTDVRTCYKKQLGEDPEWSDRLILDLAIKKTGRVSEVSVAPGRVKRAPIGKCLMASVPRWKFPRFTGETDEGITQEVVNASFPFAFSAR